MWKTRIIPNHILGDDTKAQQAQYDVYLFGCFDYAWYYTTLSR